MSTQEVPLSINVHAEDLSDRRDSSRVSYEASLGVAAFQGDGVPRGEAFVRVQGSDFSHSGVSYTTRHWPPAAELVLMFGARTKPPYAVGQIICCQLLPR